jgi:hypothetical protein
MQSKRDKQKKALELRKKNLEFWNTVKDVGDEFRGDKIKKCEHEITRLEEKLSNVYE